MFPRLRGSHNLRIKQNPVAKEFLLACEFVNVLTCLRRTNQIVAAFNVPPPQIHEYLQMRQ